MEGIKVLKKGKEYATKEMKNWIKLGLYGLGFPFLAIIGMNFASWLAFGEYYTPITDRRILLYATLIYVPLGIIIGLIIDKQKKSAKNG